MTVNIPKNLPWSKQSKISGYDLIGDKDETYLILDGDPSVVNYAIHAINTYPALVEALEMAREFIVNGVETGRIYLPDEPDPALKTLPAILAALKAAGAEP